MDDPCPMLVYAGTTSGEGGYDRLPAHLPCRGSPGVDRLGRGPRLSHRQAPRWQRGSFMIDQTLDTVNSILYVRLKSPLETEDFAQLAQTADPHIEKTGGLAGLIIEAPGFPGWDSLGAMAAHFR